MVDISPDENEPALPKQRPDGPARAVRRIMTIGAVLNIGLVVYGAIRFASAWRAGPEGVCAGIGILAVYALIGWFGAPATGRLDPAMLWLAFRFGATIGGMFAISMLKVLPLAARPTAGGSARCCRRADSESCDVARETAPR
jgi:hypothetical protein